MAPCTAESGRKGKHRPVTARQRPVTICICIPIHNSNHNHNHIHIRISILICISIYIRIPSRSGRGIQGRGCYLCFYPTGANPLAHLFLYMLFWTLPVLLVSFFVSVKR